MVLEAEPNGPAYRAGVRQGDVVVRFGNEDIPTIDHLLRQLSDARVGVATELVVIRRSEKLTFNVTPEGTR